MTGPSWPVVEPTAARRSLSEVGVVILAVATWCGATLARPLPLAIGAGVALVAVAVRRPVLLIAGVALAASSLAATAWAGLVPLDPTAYAGSVLLVSDPAQGPGGLHADAKLDDGSRVEVWVRGGPARTIGDALAGERIGVRGQLEPPPDGATWLAVRHVVGRLTVDAVTSAPESNDPFAQLANAYRRVLVTGAHALPAEQRPLFLGFVLGDDRGQAPAVVDDFRGSGLSHLLVVSGQNVAFLLVLARPFLRRLTMTPRLLVVFALLAWFAMLTRFEPSVLRATGMAAVSAVAVFRGVPLSPVRALALAVTALVLIDPLLPASVGFQLSVGAALGIVLLAARLAVALPGPTALRESLAVTMAAQVGVAPVLVTVFGGVPPVSLLANLLAVPAAGPVMMWGLTAGAASGLIGPLAGGLVARLLHLPTRLLLGWVALVARGAAALPLGTASLVHVGVAALGGVVFVRARRRRQRALAVGAACVIVVALLAPAVALQPVRLETAELDGGAQLWRAPGHAVLVVARATARPADVLEGVRRHGVARLDLVVVASRAASAEAVVETLQERVEIGDVWRPGEGAPVNGTAARIGSLLVVVRENDPRLLVDVTDTAT